MVISSLCFRALVEKSTLNMVLQISSSGFPHRALKAVIEFYILVARYIKCIDYRKRSIEVCDGPLMFIKSASM